MTEITSFHPTSTLTQSIYKHAIPYILNMQSNITKTIFDWQFIIKYYNTSYVYQHHPIYRHIVIVDYSKLSFDHFLCLFSSSIYKVYVVPSLTLLINSSIVSLFTSDATHFKRLFHWNHSFSFVAPWISFVTYILVYPEPSFSFCIVR